MQVPLVAGANGGGPTAPPSVQGAAAAPTTGGGPAPGTDLASAITALQDAIGKLSAAIQAMQGAGQVAGGGEVTGGGASPTQSGCGCGGGSATTDPSQYTGAQGAPSQEAPSQGANGGTQTPPQTPPATSPGDSAGGSVRDKIVATAKAELAKGVNEDAGKDKDKAGEIVKYRGAVTGPGESATLAEPWCADFASWVWQQAGVPFGKDGQGEDWTVAMIATAKKNNSYHERGSYEPKPGDLVMIDWGRGQDVDHVAVVTEVKDGKVHTIGGNESDSIKEASYPIGDSRMMGYITPAGG